MQDVRSAVIAAAGMGTRIGLGIPKCMIEVNGTTLLTRMIHTLRDYVEQIYLVVGYREEMVIDYCSRHHRDVIIVRNPDYRTTNTAYSFAKGAQNITGKVLYLDGDLLMLPESLKKFIEASRDQSVLVGLTDAKSENTVYAHGDVTDGLIEVTGFSREQRSPLEWANIVIAPNDMLHGANGYVYERLAEHLPLQGHMIELAEIDTAADFDVARTFAQKIDNQQSDEVRRLTTVR